ncbi:MAG: alpha/beta hydrolase [Verrucomicrobiota bacterium]
MNLRALCGLALGWMLGGMLMAQNAPTPQEPALFPGKRSDWHGYDRYEFPLADKSLIVIRPKQPLPGNPWAWKGEFLDAFPGTEIALLGKGFHIVHYRTPNMLGCPDVVQQWNAAYQELTEKHHLAKKMALIGLSRGGLYCYNWAAANPDKVACIYADAAVCDFKSWPGGKGKGKGSPGDWKLVLDRYHFNSEAEALAYKLNPVDNLAPLAKAGIPLIHVYGDADDVVPWEENTGIIAERYRKLGGTIVLIGKPGIKHHPHGLTDPTPVVDFILKHAAGR